MNDKEFWDSVEATKEERLKGAYYLRERGLEEHFNVLLFLNSFKRAGNKKVTYNEIATVLRYDKRIRRCLFKYIGVVEERLRAHFMDFYRNNASKLVKTKEFNKEYSKQGKDFYKTITHLMFKPLILLFKKQEKAFKKSVFGDVENMDTNLNALVDLRNQVYHNKFLLNNLEFKSCKYDGVKQASLYANIKNLYCFSDADCRNALIREINACANYHLPKYKNQVNWKLPKDVMLSFDDDFLF